MSERSEKIAKGVDDAKLNALVLEKSKKEYEEILTKAKAEANKAFQDGKKEVEAKRVEMLEAAKNEVAGIINNGKKALEAEKTKMVEEAKKEITSLGMLVAEKIMGEKSK